MPEKFFRYCRNLYFFRTCLHKYLTNAAKELLYVSKGSSNQGLKIILFLILAAAAAAALIFFSKAKDESEADEMFTMPTNALRVEFLNKQGWIVKPDPVSKEDIIIPSVFDGAFAEYAELQTEQGFDLEKFMGKDAVVIKYQILNYPDHPEDVFASMIICDDRLIGGDISVNGEDGTLEPLIAASAQTFLTAE